MVDDADFSATASYFERRAGRAASEPRRVQLSLAAALYRRKARDEAAEVSAATRKDDPRPLERRQRLIELFRSQRP